MERGMEPCKRWCKVSALGSPATIKQICRMRQKGLLPEPGEWDLGIHFRGTALVNFSPAPTVLTMGAEDTALWEMPASSRGTRRGAWSPRRGSQQRKRDRCQLRVGLNL